jgi:hypothetical protein
MAHTLTSLEALQSIDYPLLPYDVLLFNDEYGGFVSSARETSSVERRLDALDANGAR